MLSLIIISNNQQKRREYIEKHCKILNIHPLDITFIETETAIKQNKASIGIEEIKNIHKKLYFKPIKSKVKAVILEDAHLLTIEAQNACLKILEEPPNNTVIILAADSKEALLPTIISRCQIVQLKIENEKLTDKQRKELSEFIKIFPGMTIGEKFKKAEQLSKDKEKIFIWLKSLIVFLHQEFIHSRPDVKNADYLHLLTNFQKLYQTLRSTNTNPRFALEYAFLQFA